MYKNEKLKVEMDKINQMAEKLAEQLAKGYTEDFKAYLQVASQFHTYSLNNKILIYSQMPSATKVASLKTWNKLGRRIKKGVKSIKIFGRPRFKRVVEKEDGTKEDVYYGSCPVVSVFDISQTEGKDIPVSCFKALGDEGLELYNLLKEIMQAQGIQVSETFIAGGAQGVSYGGRVEILSTLDGTNKLLTLIHEFAHELLHKGSENRLIPRGIKECQAEACAYVVANYLGIDSPISSDYLINWGNTAETLKANLSPVIEASKTIIKLISSANMDVTEDQPEEELEAA